MTSNTVVLYEHDPNLIQSIKKFLDTSPFNLHTCQSDEELFDVAHTLTPDYYILSSELIRSDYLKRLAQLHDNRCKPIKIILMTNSHQDYFAPNESIQVLKKPFSCGALFSRLSIFDPIQQDREYAATLLENIHADNHPLMKGVTYSRYHDALFRGQNVFVADGPTHDKHIIMTHCSHSGICSILSHILTYEVFSGMVRKGFAFQQIIKEIMHKLSNILPKDVEFYISYVLYEHDNERIKIYNGSPNPIYAFKKSSQMLVNHPGVKHNLNANESCVYKTNVTTLDHALDWLIFYQESDFSQDLTTKEILSQYQKSEEPTEIFQSTLNMNFGLTVSIDASQFQQDNQSAHAPASDNKALDLDIKYALNHDALKHWDPLPVIMHTLMEQRPLHAYRTEIYTILVELYTNALDHGILELDSKHKENPQGIAIYYELRKQRLENLQRGHIDIDVNLMMNQRGGALTFTLKDSGKGFDVNEVQAKNLYSGRGISMLQALCKHVAYTESGTKVVATFEFK